MTFRLIYHDVAPPGEADSYGFPGRAAARYKLDPRSFDAHLDAIAASGVNVGLSRESAGASLTFDDGGASAIATADALESRGWRGHYFITTGRIGSPGFLNAEEILELHRRGHEVGSHSDSHPTYMGTLSRPELAREWRRSREVLGDILGHAPTTAAVPGGFVSRDVVSEAARAGYLVLMTSQPTAKPSWHDDICVLGRFTVWANTSPVRAAGYARGSRWARASLWLAWQAKSAPKRVSPRAYELVRQKWARGVIAR